MHPDAFFPQSYRTVRARTEVDSLLLPTMWVTAATFLATLFGLRVIAHVDQAVLLWPVSAVGLGLVLPAWHHGWWRRGQLLVAAAVGLLLACPLLQMPWTIAASVGLLTCLDILICASILHPAVRTFHDLRSQANITRFLIAITVGPLVTGSLSAFQIASYLHQSWRQTAETNTLSVSLGLALITPVLLAAQDKLLLKAIVSRLSTRRALTAISCLAAVTGYVFWQNTSPFLFMVFPPLIFLLLTTGLEGALSASLIVTTIGWVGTTHGHGPILLMSGTAIDHLNVLQVFAFVCVASAMPVGVLLDERTRAEKTAIGALQDKSLLAQELEASRHLFVSFAEHSPHVTYMKDAEGRYVYCNQRLADLFGRECSAWIGRSDYDLFPASFADRFRANDLEVLNTNEVLEIVEKVQDPAGTLRSFKSIKFPFQAADGTTMLAGVSIDVTNEVLHAEQLASANRQLELLSVTDPLTGLPNRRAFEGRAETEYSAASASDRHLSFAILDVDNFKIRNDRYGHGVGDEALKVLGAVLHACARPTDLVARLGGEEFGIILPDTRGSEAIEVIDRVRAMLALADHGPTALTVSVGIATTGKGTQEWNQLLADADQAMYQAKRTGKNKWVHHDELTAELGHVLQH